MKLVNAIHLLQQTRVFYKGFQHGVLIHHLAVSVCKNARIPTGGAMSARIPHGANPILVMASTRASLYL